MLQFRASQVGRLMAYPDKNTLAQGALTYIGEVASQILLDWQPELDMYMVEKGLQCEDESIDLLNDLYGTSYAKNHERITGDLLTGEWDIYDQVNDLIIDIKTAYSKKTFPIALKEGDRKMYEWQLTAYMHLKGADNAAIAYTLVDTPPHLIGARENPDWHQVSHIQKNLRVTGFNIQRDAEREEQMLNKLKLAQDHLKEILDSKGFDYSFLEVSF